MPTISTTDYWVDQAKRRLTPSINNFPGMGAAGTPAAAHRVPAEAHGGAAGGQ